MRVGFEKNVLGDESVKKVVEEKGIQVKCQDGTFEAFNAGNDNDLVVIAQVSEFQLRKQTNLGNPSQSRLLNCDE